jgi:hypothetical protein
LIEVIKHAGFKTATNILIDTEYPGHERTIMKMLHKFIDSDTACLGWGFVGKGSRSHDLAYKVFKRKLKADTALKAEKAWKTAKIIAGENLNLRLKRRNRNSDRLK